MNPEVRKQMIRQLEQFAHFYKIIPEHFREALNASVERFIYELEPVKYHRRSLYRYYEARRQKPEPISLNEQIWRVDR